MASPSSSNRNKAGRSSIAPPAPTHEAPTLLPHGKHRGKPGMTLNRPFTLAGARNRAHLHLVSSTVSKCHAAIVHDNGRVYVRDLCSRTHVYVNGRVIHEMELSNGDLVQIGSFTFKLQHPDPAHDSPAPPPGQLVESNNGGGMLPMEGRTTVIGRRPGCDLHIDDESVSTIHAIIFELDGQRYVRDLGSRTGTFVNGVAAHQQPLNFNDRLRVGPREFIYRPGEAGAGTFEDMEELEDLVGTARLGHDELQTFTGGRTTVAEPGVPPEEGISTVQERQDQDRREPMAGGVIAAGGADLIPLASDDDWMPQEPAPAEAQAEEAAPEPIDLDADNGVGAGPEDTVGMPVAQAPSAPPTISPMVEDLSALPVQPEADAAEETPSAEGGEPVADDFFAELAPGQASEDVAWDEMAPAESVEQTEPIDDVAQPAAAAEAAADGEWEQGQDWDAAGGTLGMHARAESSDAPAEQAPEARSSEPAEFPEMDDLGMSAHVIGVMPAQWARGPEATPLAVGPTDADALDSAAAEPQPSSESPAEADIAADQRAGDVASGWTEQLGEGDLPMEGESTIAGDAEAGATDLAGFEYATEDASPDVAAGDAGQVDELPAVEAGGDESLAADADVAADFADAGEIEAGDIDPSLTEAGLLDADSVSAADIDLDELMADEPAASAAAPAEARDIPSMDDVATNEQATGDESSPADADADAIGLDAETESAAPASPEQTDVGLDFIDEHPAGTPTAPEASALAGGAATGASAASSAIGTGVAIGAMTAAGAPAAGAAASSAAAASPADAAPPKRSLWSRLFGRKPAAPAPEASTTTAGGAAMVAAGGGAAAFASPTSADDAVSAADLESSEDAALDLPPPMPEDSSHDLGHGEGQGWPPRSGTAVAIGGMAGDATDQRRQDPSDQQTGVEESQEAAGLEAETTLAGEMPEPTLTQSAPTEESPANEWTGAATDFAEAPSMPSEDATPPSIEDDWTGAGAGGDGGDAGDAGDVAAAADRPRPTIGVAEIALSAGAGHGSQIVLSGMGPVEQLWSIASGRTLDLPPADELPELPDEQFQPAAMDAEAPAFDSFTSTPMPDIAAPETAVTTESFDVAAEGTAGTAGEELPDSFFQELIEPQAAATGSAAAAGDEWSPTEELEAAADAATPIDAGEPVEPLADQPAEAPAESAAEPFQAHEEFGSMPAPEAQQPQSDPYSMMGRDQGFHFGGMPLPLGSLAPAEAARPMRPRLPFADRPVTMDTRAEMLAEVSMVESEVMPMFGASLPPGMRDDSRLTPMRSDLMPLGGDEDDLDLRPVNRQSAPAAPATPAPQEVPLPAGASLANAGGELPAAAAPQSADAEAPAVGGELPGGELHGWSDESRTSVAPPEVPESGQSTIDAQDTIEPQGIDEPSSTDSSFADLLDELELPEDQQASEGLDFQEDDWSTAEAADIEAADTEQPHESAVADNYLPEAGRIVADEPHPLGRDNGQALEVPLEEPPVHPDLHADDALHETLSHLSGETDGGDDIGAEPNIDAPGADDALADALSDRWSDQAADETPSSELAFDLENLADEPADEPQVETPAEPELFEEPAPEASAVEPIADDAADQNDVEAVAAAEELFEPGAADVIAAEPAVDESAVDESAEPLSDDATIDDLESHVSHAELVHDDGHNTEPPFDGEHAPSPSWTMLPGPDASAESTVAAEDAANPPDMTSTTDLESAAEEMPSADWFDLPEAPVSEDLPGEDQLLAEEPAPQTPQAPSGSSTPPGATGAVAVGAAGVAAAAAAARAPLAGAKPGMVARRPGAGKAAPLSGAKSANRAAPGAAAPLARKLDKQAGPRRVIAAKPTSTGLTTGFRPPVFPTRAQPGAGATPPATVVKPLGAASPAVAGRRVGGAAPVPARDPFTNTGDMTAPAVVPAAPSKRRLIYILLAVALTVGAIVAVWLMMQPGASVQGKLQYRGLDNPTQISEDVRSAFQAQQIATLTDRQVLEEARREVLDDGMSLGFLDDSREETLRLTRALSDAHWVDRNLIINYQGVTGEADRKRMLALLRAVKRRYDQSPKASLRDEKSLNQARSRSGQINVELSQNAQSKEQAVKLVEEGPQRQAEAESFRKKADELKAEFEGLPQKIRAIEKEIATLENLPKTGIADDDSDPELKRQMDQLKSLNQSLSAAVEAATTNAGAPKEMLDAAQHQFDQQVAAARDAAAGNIVLSGYLDKLSALQAELRRHNEELEQQQKDQREMLEKLRVRLAQETAARIQRAWDADPQLRKLVDRRAVVERQHNVASASKLPEAQKLGAEMAELDKQIEAHRELIQAKDEYDPLTKQFLTFIDDSVKLVDQSRKRNEKRLKDLFEAFVAAKPDMDKLPADQQARAKSLDDAYNALSSARAQYQAALDETNVRADLAVRELTQQVASQQAKVDARKRELADARALAAGQEDAPSPEMAEPERLASIEKKRRELNEARQSEAKLQNEWVQTTLAARGAEAEADQADAARLNIERLDAERIALTEEQHRVNQQLDSAIGDPLAAVTIADIEPESAVLVAGEDKRMTYSFLASAGGLFLVLMALAASRTPGIYIPPMSQQPVYAQLYDEAEVAGVGVGAGADAFSMPGRRSA